MEEKSSLAVPTVLLSTKEGIMYLCLPSDTNVFVASDGCICHKSQMHLSPEANVFVVKEKCVPDQIKANTFVAKDKCVHD